MYKSVYEFPGDQQAMPLAQPVLAQTDPAYLGTAEAVMAVAEGVGLPLGEDTHERMRRGSVLFYHLDQLLDSAVPSSSSFRANIGTYNRAISMFKTGEVSSLQPESLQALGSFVLSSTASLSHERMGAVESDLLAIGGLLPNKIKAMTANEYTTHAAAEGRHTGYAVTGFVSDTEAAHPRYPHFRQATGNLMTLGAIADNLLDLREDYERSYTNVTPTIANRARLAGASIVAFARGAKAYPRTVWPVARVMHPAYKAAKRELEA